MDEARPPPRGPARHPTNTARVGATPSSAQCSLTPSAPPKVLASGPPLGVAQIHDCRVVWMTSSAPRAQTHSPPEASHRGPRRQNTATKRVRHARATGAATHVAPQAREPPVATSPPRRRSSETIASSPVAPRPSARATSVLQLSREGGGKRQFPERPRPQASGEHTRTPARQARNCPHDRRRCRLIHAGRRVGTPAARNALQPPLPPQSNIGASP